MRETPRRSRRLLGAVALLCALAAAGCGTTSPGPTAKATEKATEPAATPVTASVWTSISLPTAAATPVSWAVAPDDPNTLFVCARNMLWRSRDGGSHWERVTLSAASGTGCAVAFAADDPRVMAFAVTNSGFDWQPDDRNTLFVSRDGGTTWAGVSSTPVLPPSQAGGGSVQTAVVVSARALFLWYSYDSYGGGGGTPQVSALERTEDGGATWTRIDGAFGAGALFFPPKVGPDGALAASVYVEGSGAAPARLWLSTDAGDSWRQSGAIPDHAGQVLLTTPPRSSGAWLAAGSPLYALIAEQIPSALYRESVVQTEDGQHWALLPPLPVPGTNSIQYGIFQALAVAPDGRLLVFGADPRTGVPPQGDQTASATPVFWLWIWDPRAGRWSVLSQPLAFSGRVIGALGWQAQLADGADGATYLYAADWFDSGNDALFRIRLPAPSGGM